MWRRAPGLLAASYSAGQARQRVAWGISTSLFAKLTLTLSAGASCLLSGFDLHGEIDSLGSALEYTKDNP